MQAKSLLLGELTDLILNTLRQKQNAKLCAENIFKYSFKSWIFYCDSHFTGILLRITFENESPFITVMTWCWTSNKPLPESLMSCFTQAYMHQWVLRNKCIAWESSPKELCSMFYSPCWLKIQNNDRSHWTFSTPCFYQIMVLCTFRLYIYIYISIYIYKTHDLVMSYGNIHLDQHQLKYWLVAWWHQAIT